MCMSNLQLTYLVVLVYNYIVEKKKKLWLETNGRIDKKEKI